VHVLVPDQLNTYDVLVSDDIVFTRSALEEFLAGPAKGRSATATARESEVDPAELEVTSSPGETTEPTDGAPKAVTKKAATKKTAKKAAKKTAEKADKAEAGPAKKAAAKKAPAKKAAAKKTEPAADEAGTDGSDT
jgi:large subunit ribosomal protein L4